MARPSNAPLRRRQIVRALGRLLPSTGFAGASTKAIAKEAGLSAGLVHHHFGSKLEILVAVVEELGDTLAARQPAHPTTARQRVHHHVEAWLAPGDGAHPHAVACWAAIGAEAVLHEAVGSVYRAALTAQVERLAADLAEAAPHRSASEARAMAALVHATIEGAFRLHASAPGTIPEGTAAPGVAAWLDAWMEAP